nr:hypothetical protein [Streptomyces benahoarensis]
MTTPMKIHGEPSGIGEPSTLMLSGTSVSAATSTPRTIPAIATSAASAVIIWST